MKTPFPFASSAGVLFCLLLSLTLDSLTSASAQSLPPVVGIRADPARTSEPNPLALILPGRFIVSRSGDRTESLRVSLSYSGTASAADYELLPESVLIPAGKEAVEILVLARADELVEGTETVIAKVMPPGPPPNPSISLPPYTVSPLRPQATVEIADDDKPDDSLPVVSIAADPAQTSEPSPLIRVAPGAFVLKRTGPAKGELLIGISLAGTATKGRDYQDVPTIVIFKEGESSVTLQVVAIDDEIVERDETVVAELTEPVTAGAVKRYEIDKESNRAVVTIHDPDANSAEPSLHITKPESGEVFRPGATIEVQAVAVDPDGYIPRVEFYANEKLIAISEIFFIQAPPDGSPIVHNIEYTNAPAGTNVLVAKAVDSNGEKVISELVRIVVGASSKASLAITSPRDGSEVPAGKPLTIAATAIDPESYIARVEFYDGRTFLGASRIDFIVAPPPGTPIHHEFVWENPPVGEHTLIARAKSTAGLVESDAVRISAVRETGSDQRVVLGITAPDPVALESAGDNPGVFRITRVRGAREVPVTAHLSIGGTAKNGVDYAELPTEITIPAGREAVELVVKPVPDKALEGEETVVIELLPPVCIAIEPPPLDCYLVANDAGSARAVIREENSDNIPPGVAIVSPKHGAVIEKGGLLPIRAEAADRDGEILRLDIYADERLLASTKLAHLSTVWTNPAPGIHSLIAVALDDKGVSSTSAVVKVMVQENDPAVVRELPEGYTAGAPFTVTLLARPQVTVLAWAVEDRAPDGWKVDEISHEGIFDGATGKVKFGPFSDARERTLSYRVLPPAQADGRFEFAGTFSADGKSSRIGGDRVIASVNPHHPADLNHDWHIALDEVTSFMSDWQEGMETSLASVTRAAMLWRNGELYRFDLAKGVPPLCWVSSADTGAVRSLAASSATRVINGRRVSIQLDPAPGSSASAVEETLPPGWAPIGISNGGIFDPGTSVIKWGVFMEGQPQVVTYEIVNLIGEFNGINFAGRFSVDGRNSKIGGATVLVAATEPAPSRLANCERKADGKVRLNLTGVRNQVLELEVSPDLENWDKVSDLFLPDGQLEFIDDSSGSNQLRFYRLVAR